MAASREGTSPPATPSTHPVHTIQRQRYLEDYDVQYAGQQSVEQIHGHEEEREQPSPARSTFSMPAKWSAHEAIMRQAMETARQ